MPLNLAVIPGDGTGPEVIEQALAVLDAAAEMHGFEGDWTVYPFGGQRYLDSDIVLDDADITRLRTHDAILLGAVGHPDVKPGILEKGLLLKLRFELDQYINLRPVRLYEGVQTPLRDKGPDDIDMVVVRENTEDLYTGAGGVARRGTPHEVATQEMLTTRFGVDRCLRYAFDLARTRRDRNAKPGKLTLVHKTNVLTYAGDLWHRGFTEMGDAEYQDIEREYHHVDACCMYMVTRPESYDVIVSPNMFGDIITDLGAAIAGGMGIAASGNLNPAPGGLSMFEPVHGSSPDIAGQGKANPLAAIESVAMLLSETGRATGGDVMLAAGRAVNQAVQRVTPRFDGLRLDRSGMSTRDIGQLVLDALGV